jgi:chemotaxis protein methyltransferase CheR
MKAHEFKLLRRILKECAGIDFREDKIDLVASKLRPLLAELAFPSFAHLTLALMKPESERLRSRVAQTIAVLESYFFRDKAPFKYFAEVMLPRLMEKRAASRQVRIWCAASSTGQEPYSLAMLLCDEARKLDGWNIEIVATDFSEDALRKAKAAHYTQFEVQRGLPVSNLVKYFCKSGSGWQIKPEVSDKVSFREHNLLNECRDLGRFDIIFCRNVLIYFDEELRCAVLGRLARQLAPDGYLVLGAAETTTRTSPDFTSTEENHHGIFCLTPDATAVRLQAQHLSGLPRSHGRRARGATEDSHLREIKLDRGTADLLETRARARGLTLPELLAEYAAAEPPMATSWANIKAPTR